MNSEMLMRPHHVAFAPPAPFGLGGVTSELQVGESTGEMS